MSTDWLELLTTPGMPPSLPDEAAQRAAHALAALCGAEVYPRSLAAQDGALWFLARRGAEKQVGSLATPENQAPRPLGASHTVDVDGKTLVLCLGPANPANAARARAAFPFLVARPLGLQKSAGCGDRLGLATPGHIRALRAVFPPGAKTRMAPIFAQQSIRENVRTGRTPQEVMDDAMWGVFQEGWRDGFGADADHLKTFADVDQCAAAGYTFYTVDPGDTVDDRANRASAAELRTLAAGLPWGELQDTPADLERRLTGRAVELDGLRVAITPEQALRAAVKYGGAVAHTAAMYRHLAAVMGARPYELEMSVDETETVTSLAEHIYIAGELQRLGVRCVSLAPRYVGSFEKGADYIGDLKAFEQSFREHLAVAKTFGPYKLSLHSGSDKFSIYPIAAAVAGELVHLKTAGTSYLEALRAVAAQAPDLFRAVVAFARARYPTDRASYHVSAELDKMPDVTRWPDDELPRLLDDFHGREVLHVTFGSVLNHAPFRAPFFATLQANEETYYAMLERHFIRHFVPFAA